jgi:hypothetical protein
MEFARDAKMGWWRTKNGLGKIWKTMHDASQSNSLENGCRICVEKSEIVYLRTNDIMISQFNNIPILSSPTRAGQTG